MRISTHARLLLGVAMILGGLGLLAVGATRWFAEQGVPSTMVLDGRPMIGPEQYVAPWVLAAVLVAAAVYLLRGARDRVF